MSEIEPLPAMDAQAGYNQPAKPMTPNAVPVTKGDLIDCPACQGRGRIPRAEREAMKASCDKCGKKPADDDTLRNSGGDFLCSECWETASCCD